MRKEHRVKELITALLICLVDESQRGMMHHHH